MIPAWSPEAWNSFGVVGVVVFTGVTLFVALTRGWLVIGRYHNEVMARSEKDAEAIRILSEAITEKNATEDATTKILEALRKSVTSGGQ